jgi:hypothetical protein
MHAFSTHNTFDGKKDTKFSKNIWIRNPKKTTVTKNKVPFNAQQQDDKCQHEPNRPTAEKCIQNKHDVQELFILNSVQFTSETSL